MMNEHFTLTLWRRDDFEEVATFTARTATEAKAALENIRRAVPAILSRGINCENSVMVIYSRYDGTGKYHSAIKYFAL